jgi:hypothetical protein
MVEPEIAGAVHQRCGSGNTALGQRGNIGLRSAPLDIRRAKGGEQCGDLSRHFDRRIVASDQVAGWLEDSVVGFNCEHVLVDLTQLCVAVGSRAAKPVLLVGPQHDPDGTTGAKPELLNQTHRFPRGDAPTCIIHCALTHIPGIDVPTDDDYFIGLFTAAQLCHDVAGLRIGEVPGLHLESQQELVAALLHPMQHHRVLSAQSGGWNPLHGGIVPHASGVRVLNRIGAHRSDQAGDRSRLGCFDRADGAISHRGPVSGERDIEQYDLAGNLSRPRGEFLEAVHDHHGRRYSFGWSANAPAEPDHVQLHGARPQQRRRFVPSHPMRNSHRLTVNVLQPIALHLSDDPVKRIFERFRAAQPVTELVGEGRGAIPCRAVSQGGRDDSIG